MTHKEILQRARMHWQKRKMKSFFPPWSNPAKKHRHVKLWGGVLHGVSVWFTQQTLHDPCLGLQYIISYPFFSFKHRSVPVCRLGILKNMRPTGHNKYFSGLHFYFEFNFSDFIQLCLATSQWSTLIHFSPFFQINSTDYDILEKFLRSPSLYNNSWHSHCLGKFNVWVSIEFKGAVSLKLSGSLTGDLRSVSVSVAFDFRFITGLCFLQ